MEEESRVYREHETGPTSKLLMDEASNFKWKIEQSARCSICKDDTCGPGSDDVLDGLKSDREVKSTKTVAFILLEDY